MASSESRLAALFTEGVSSSAEGELTNDETTSTVSLVPNVRVIPGESAVVEEDEECVEESGDVLRLPRRALLVITKEREITTIVLSTS